MKIFKEFTFEAAHKLPLVPEDHKCSNLHGHSFRVKIYLDGPLNEFGWVMDFSQVKSICSPIIAIWLWNNLIGHLQNLSSIEVMETCNSGCEYSG